MSDSTNWKIYTKKGDTGETSLIGGGRVLKSDIQIEAYGTVDELNSFVGLLRDKIQNEHYEEILLSIQNNLFVIESHLALEKGKVVTHIPGFDDNSIILLEQEIDVMETQLPTLTNFVLPGGHELNSLCHICRTVSRRAERIIIAMQKENPTDAFILKYINRLSDYFFVLSRRMTYLHSASEILWIPNQ